VTIRSFLLICTLAAGIIATAEGVVAEPLETPIAWSDDEGPNGIALFEGTIDAESLTGTLDFGGETFQVEGTVDSEGAVAGEVATAGGAPVLTFETTAIGTEVAGQYETGEESGGVWVTETAEPPQGIPDVPD